MAKKKAPSPIQPRALKTPKASLYTGLSGRTLLDYAHQGKIPYIRAGTKLFLFDVADLDRFMDERKVGAK
jgi:excisionase family DNA binding protein